MYYVYALVAENGKYYFGSTSDLKKRIASHNKGKNRSTKGKKWKLVYYEAYISQKDAFVREKKLK